MGPVGDFLEIGIYWWVALLLAYGRHIPSTGTRTRQPFGGLSSIKKNEETSTQPKVTVKGETGPKDASKFNFESQTTIAWLLHILAG